MPELKKHIGEIIVWGNASKKNVATLKVFKEDLKLSLMTFLQANQLPIASSCLGKGVCKKCITIDDTLSCQTALQNIFDDKNKIYKVGFHYL